jgi:hypothetical protein
MECSYSAEIEDAGPLYQITAPETAGAIKVPNQSIVIEMDIPSSWKTQGSDATFFCQVDRNGGTGAVSGTIGSGGSAVNISGSDYATAKIPLNWISGKYALSVNLNCSNSCTCGIGW